MITTAAAWRRGDTGGQHRVVLRKHVRHRAPAGAEGFRPERPHAGEGFRQVGQRRLGKIAARKVNGKILEDYARRFGFDERIPFELPVLPSLADIPRTTWPTRPEPPPDSDTSR